MKLILAVLLFLTVPNLVHAQTPKIDRIEIRAAGIYEAGSSKLVKDTNVVAGVRNAVQSFKFMSIGTTVPMQKKIRFGIEYVIVGAPAGASVSLRQVIVFPGTGLRNPAKLQTWEHDEREITRRIGRVVQTGYRFDEDWEMVPGTWTFQLWDGNRKLAEQDFTVVRP